MKVNDTELMLLCSCEDRDHQLWIRYDEDFIYIEPKLNREFRFWQRLLAAFRFVFRMKPCTYGDFDEIVVTDKQVIAGIAEYFATANKTIGDAHASEPK